MVTNSQLVRVADHAENDVSDSQLVRVADHAENDVTDSQLVKAAEQQEEMDCDEDDLLCQALDEEMERQPMYGGGAPLQAPPVEPEPPQPQQAPPVQPPVEVQVPPLPPPQPLQAQAPVQQAALNDTARRVTFYPVYQLDILQSMNELELQVTNMLQHEMERHRGIKWYMALTAEFSKTNAAGELITSEQVFRSVTMFVVNDDDILNQLAAAMREIYQHSQEFQAEGSGWALERVISLAVHTVAYQPLMGNSYIKLPAYIAAKKAVINVQNNDDKCILWSILAFLFPANSNVQRVTKYRPYERHLNMTGVAYPTPLHDIGKIEKNNNLSINVIGYDSTDGFYPLRITRNISDRHINLLLIKEGDKCHYCLYKELQQINGKTE